MEKSVVKSRRGTTDHLCFSTLSAVTSVIGNAADGWETFRASMSRRPLIWRVRRWIYTMWRDNCIPFVSRGSKGAASRGNHCTRRAKRGSVRAQTSPPSPRPSRSTAHPLYPTIHLSARSIDHGGCKWSSLPFTRASGTLRERITDFHRAALHRGACGRGRARPGSFMLERMIEISCNVIIAHSPFRSPSRCRSVASRPIRYARCIAIA